jgi:hypothetical protein
VAHTPDKNLSLLPLLDEQITDDLETETLDFKECPTETKLHEALPGRMKYEEKDDQR